MLLFFRRSDVPPSRFFSQSAEIHFFWSLWWDHRNWHRRVLFEYFLIATLTVLPKKEEYGVWIFSMCWFWVRDGHVEPRDKTRWATGQNTVPKPTICFIFRIFYSQNQLRHQICYVCSIFAKVSSDFFTVLIFPQNALKTIKNTTKITNLAPQVFKSSGVFDSSVEGEKITSDPLWCELRA